MHTRTLAADGNVKEPGLFLLRMRLFDALSLPLQIDSGKQPPVRPLLSSQDNDQHWWLAGSNMQVCARTDAFTNAQQEGTDFVVRSLS